jgi:outer membrane lipoprotein SlyB
MSQLISISVVALLFLSGCAKTGVPEYSGQDYNQIKRYDIGVVEDARLVIISDDGMGTFLGAIIGGVVGSTMGRGAGNTLATLGGGLVGGYAGSQIAKANAVELSVKLDNGENIVVVAKGTNIVAGDRVKIIKDGSKVAQVYKIN